MKKLLVFFLVLTLTAGFVMAEGLGLTAGLEFGIEGVNKPNDAEDMGPYLYPNIAYENSFLDGALDVFADLGFTVYFTKGWGGYGKDKDGKDATPMSLYFDLGATYNLFFGDSTLSFTLENEIDPLVLSARLEKNEHGEDAKNMTSIFWPGVTFNQKLSGIGDIYANARLGIMYLQDSYKDETPMAMELKFGWVSEFGLGLWVREDLALNKYAGCDGESGHIQFNFLVSYETGPLYAEVEINIPKEFDKNGGITITPKAEYTIMDGLNVWLKAEIGGIGEIGVDKGDVGISPALGVTYSF